MSLYYFRAPNFDINPASPTAPRLGSIFLDLKKLAGPLNQDNHESPEPKTMNTNPEHNFTDYNLNDTSGSVGLYANLSKGLGGSFGLIFGFKRDSKYIYHCDVLETTEFVPSREYVIRCLRASQTVQEVIDQLPFGRKSVYMITGLKIATGFTRRGLKSSENKPQVQIGVDGAALGYPAGGGLATDFTFSEARAVSSDSDSIVFAYRAIKISPKGDDTSYKDMSGGIYGFGHGDEETEWDIMDVDPAQSFPDTISVPVISEK